MTPEEFGMIKEQLRWLAQDLHEIKTDVKNLNAFKFKVLGVAALAVCLIEIAKAKGL